MDTYSVIYTYKMVGLSHWKGLGLLLLLLLLYACVFVCGVVVAGVAADAATAARQERG